MSKKGTSKNDLKGLTYVAQKPAFLTNFGQSTPTASSSTSGRDRPGRGDGREPLPSRPSDGEWAAGSDGERQGDGEGSDDEWGDIYGGGGEEGPQVVVLKEGRHLSADEVKRERRRAAGKPSESPEPENNTRTEEKEIKKKSQLPPKVQSSAKRKLVGRDQDKDHDAKGSDGDGKKDGGGKKKKKSDKKLLSFNEDE